MGLRWLLLMCCLSSATSASVDWRGLEESLAGVKPWQRIRGLAADGRYADYVEHSTWLPDSEGLRCVGRWSYGPSYKVSVHAGASDTLVLLTRGSGATVARFRSRDSIQMRPLGEIDCYGLPHRAVMQDSLVCVGVQRGGTGLEVWSISDLARPRHLAFVSLPSVCDIAVNDTLVYLACAGDSFFIYNVAEPASPARVGGCRDTCDLAMFYTDGHCYLVHASGLNIVDVRDPTSPRRAGKIAGHAPLAVWIRDSLCYMTTEEDGFLVFDVSNPASPFQVGSLPLPASADLYLPPTCDTVAYTSYMHVINIANPASPRLIGTLDTPGWDNGVSALPTLTHVLLADYFDGIVAANVTSPAAPCIDTMALAAGAAVNVSIDGDRAYVASQYSGLAILDVSDPARPTQLGLYDTAGQSPVFCGAAVGRDSFAFMSWPRPRVLSIDVSDPGHPVRTGGCEGMFAEPEDMVLRDSFVYCAEANRFQVVNVARPRSPVLVGSCVDADYTWDLDLEGNLAAVAHTVSLRLLDVTRPDSPRVVGSWSGNVSGVDIVDTIAYVAASYTGLVSLSVADPASPYVLDSLHLTDTLWWNDVVVQESVAYVGGDRVWAVDVSDPRNLRLVTGASWTPPYLIERMEYRAPYFYAACLDAGVCILETTHVGIAEEPERRQIEPGFEVGPNPARGGIGVSYSLNTAGAVSVRLYDISGRELRTLADLRQEPGRYSVAWDGRDNSGRNVPAGIYFLRLQTENYHSQQKLVLAR